MTHDFFCITIFCIFLERISYFIHVVYISVSYCMQEKSSTAACLVFVLSNYDAAANKSPENTDLSKIEANEGKYKGLLRK